MKIHLKKLSLCFWTHVNTAEAQNLWATVSVKGWWLLPFTILTLPLRFFFNNLCKDNATTVLLLVIILENFEKNSRKSELFFKLFFHTYPVEDVGPALCSDTLVDSQHGKAQVIKMGNPVVRAWPPNSTFSAIDETAAAIASFGAWSRFLIFYCCNNIWTPQEHNTSVEISGSFHILSATRHIYIGRNITYNCTPLIQRV